MRWWGTVRACDDSWCVQAGTAPAGAAHRPRGPWIDSRAATSSAIIYGVTSHMSEASTDTTHGRPQGDAGGSGKHRGGAASTEDLSTQPHGRHRKEPHHSAA
ncbi:hypothetical protein GCM10010273_05170 [Streptomyces lavendulocolor]